MNSARPIRETSADGKAAPLSATDYTERLYSLMEQRLQTLKTLVQLADACRQAAQESEVSVTLGVLARKDILLDRLTEITNDLAEYLGDDPDDRTWQSAQRRKACQQNSEESEKLLRALVSSEEESLASLTTQRAVVAEKLQHGNDATTARHAYAAMDSLAEGSLDIGEL